MILSSLNVLQIAEFYPETEFLKDATFNKENKVLKRGVLVNSTKEKEKFEATRVTRNLPFNNKELFLVPCLEDSHFHFINTVALVAQDLQQ